jgi:hypothetical protein
MVKNVKPVLFPVVWFDDVIFLNYYVLNSVNSIFIFKSLELYDNVVNELGFIPKVLSIMKYSVIGFAVLGALLTPSSTIYLIHRVRKVSIKFYVNNLIILKELNFKLRREKRARMEDKSVNDSETSKLLSD